MTRYFFRQLPSFFASRVILKRACLKIIYFITGCFIACGLGSFSLANTDLQTQTKIPAQAQFLPLNKDKNLGPYYKATLPTSMYLNSLYPDLSDVRIRNAEGDYLAYAFIDEDTSSLKISHHVVPIFPLYLDAGDISQEQINVKSTMALNIHLHIQADGSLAKMKDDQKTSTSTSTSTSTNASTNTSTNTIRNTAQSTTVAAEKMPSQVPSEKIKGWIIDTSQLVSKAKNKQYFLQAHFEVDKNNRGVVDFSWQSSDDLQHWTSLYTNVNQQLVQLEHQGAYIQKLSIDLQNSRAKYWRLLWRNPDQTFDIKNVTITTQEKLLPSPILTWGATIVANQCDQNSCDYTLPKNTPVDSLRIMLGEQNTLAKMTIVGKRTQQIQRSHKRHLNPLYVLRHREHTSNNSMQTQEEYLHEATIYRLLLNRENATEIISDDIALNGQLYTHLRLISKNDMRSLGKQMPRIQIATLARSIVFLSRGQEPYRVHWGEENPIGAALPLTSLMPNAIQTIQATQNPNGNIGEAQLARMPEETHTANLSAAKSIASAASIELGKAEKYPYKYWLWAGLVLAVVLLGGMVWSFLKGMKEEESKETPNS